MKSLFFSLALITFVGVGAQAQVVTALATRISTATNTVTNNSRVISNALGSIGRASFNNNSVMIDQINIVTQQIETVAAENGLEASVVNGLSKVERLEALSLIFAALVKNNNENAQLNSLLNGQLYKRTFKKVDGVLGQEQFQKFVSFLQLYTEGKSADEASLQATGKELKLFADACGGGSAAPARRK